MPRINLLPFKAVQLVESARNELVIMGGVLGISLVAMYGVYLTVGSDVSGVEQRISELNQSVTALREDVKRVQSMTAEAAALSSKLATIEMLKRKKVGPAKMLDDLATIMTRLRKVWLVEMREQNGVLMLKGGAMEHENISQFQLALERESKFFLDIKLTEINSRKDGELEYLEWVIECRTNYAAG